MQRTSKKDFKYLLRDVSRNLIPKKNIENRKRGFVGLESQILFHNFENFRNQLFEREKIERQNIFNFNFLDIFLNNLKKNEKFVEREFFTSKKYFFKSLWGLIMFQKWYDTFMEN